MQFSTIVVTLLLGNALATTVSPMAKVLSLLDGLKTKLERDSEAEMKQYTEYMEWCRTNNRDFTAAIKTDNDNVEDDEATISKATADISTDDAKIEDEAATASSTGTELQEAVAIRSKENEEFKANEKELADTVDTLERATNVLQKKLRGTALLDMKVEGNDVKGLIKTLSLVVDAASLSLHDKNKLTMLVQSSQNDEADDELDSLGAPDVSAYKSHGSPVIDLLEDLKQKAETQLTAMRKQEQNARHNFGMLKQSLDEQIKVATKEMAEAKTAKNLDMETQAVGNADLASDTTDLNSDTSSLKKTKINCNTVQKEHDASVKASTEEASAIEQALEALKAVSDDGRKSSSAALVQVKSSPDQYEVVKMLRKLAQKDHSPALTQLAGQVSTAMTSSAEHGVDPFKRVREMITGLIAKMEKEAQEEGAHKEYCDKETKDSAEKKAGLASGIEKFTAQIDKANAKVATLKDSLVALQEDLSTMQKQQGEADRMRTEAAASYKVTKADLEGGMEGVRTALRVLRQFYAAASDEAALLQTKAKARTGSAVIDMLEIVESDMGKKLSNIKSEEADAIMGYKKLREANHEAKAIKEKSMRFKSRETTQLEKAITEYASDLDGAQSEMDAVRQYAANIKSMCTNKETFAEKYAKRQAELEGLQEALKVLEGSALIQTSSLRGSAVARH